MTEKVAVRRGRSGRRIAFVFGLLAAGVLLAALRYSETIATQYHLLRMRASRKYLEEVLREDPVPARTRALRKYFGSPQGQQELVRVLLEEVGKTTSCFKQQDWAEKIDRAMFCFESHEISIDVRFDFFERHAAGGGSVHSKALPALLGVIEEFEASLPEHKDLLFKVAPFPKALESYRRWIAPDNACVPKSAAGVSKAFVIEERRPVTREEIDYFSKKLGSYYAWMRKAAVDRLGQIGPEARQALPLIEKLLKDEDPDVSSAARTALESIQRN